MTKLMFAVWGEELASLLHDRALHADLADHGVGRLQLNVDDEHVAPAMRIATGEPIGAVVSAWTPAGTDPTPVVATLAARATRLAGWEVDERRRLDPPESWDGRRADALANVALLRRPSELAYDDWLHRWLVEHTGVAIRTQASFGYVQNVVVASLTAEGAHVDALVEELFVPAAMSDPHAFYGSGDDDAELARRLDTLMASVRRIGADRDLDLVPTSRYLLDLTP